MIKKAAFVGFVILVIAFAAWRVFTRSDSGGGNGDGGSQQAAESSDFDKSRYPIDEPGSLWWIVNKDRPLPEGYVPDDLVVPNITKRSGGDEGQVSQKMVSSLETLVGDAATAGLPLRLVSGYRSYGLQVSVYDQNVSQLGQAEADKVSAKPGTSEHQTGLAADLGRADGSCDLETCFGDTPEGQWIAAHAHEYGFIIRYLPGKESITGYSYEPWHLRYVGRELATELKRTGQTMEEFFGL